MRQGRIRLGATRADVLHELRDAGAPMDVATLAGRLGLHPNTTRFHLDALVGHGLVIREAETGGRPGRPRLRYRPTHAHPANPYQDLAQAMVRHLIGDLDTRAELAKAAGVAWGQELAGNAPEAEPLDRLVGSMARLGYQPELVDGPEPALQVRPCPFLEVADEDPEVVCQMHLGLAIGLLGPDQPWTVAGIEPWAEPDRCLVHLNRAGGRDA